MPLIKTQVIDPWWGWGSTRGPSTYPKIIRSLRSSLTPAPMTPVPLNRPPQLSCSCQIPFINKLTAHYTTQNIFPDRWEPLPVTYEVWALTTLKHAAKEEKGRSVYSLTIGWKARVQLKAGAGILPALGALFQRATSTSALTGRKCPRCKQLKVSIH